jgi:hypothetical protein
LPHLFDLLRPLQQEIELRRQRALASMPVESLEKRILLGLKLCDKRLARLVLPTPIGPSITIKRGPSRLLTSSLSVIDDPAPGVLLGRL